METIYQDVRYGWRMLRKSPGFALVIVLMLTLGIGANTAVFTVLSAALLRPLPFEKQEELVQVWETRTSGAFQQMEASYPDFVDMRNSQVFDGRVAGRIEQWIAPRSKDRARKCWELRYE